jgi:hypothetical protein
MCYFNLYIIFQYARLLYPWKLIWLLRLPFMKKVALGDVFGVGLVCVIMAIVLTVSVGMESRSDNTPSSP